VIDQILIIKKVQVRAM